MDKTTIRVQRLVSSLALLFSFTQFCPPAWAVTEEVFTPPDYVFEGHFSRVGNNDSPSQTVNNNIYIKFFPDRWIAMMFGYFINDSFNPNIYNIHHSGLGCHTHGVTCQTTASLALAGSAIHGILAFACTRTRHFVFHQM